MATLTATKNYADDTILTEEQLDDALQSIETFLNTTKINDDNIQTGGVGTASLAGNAVTTSKIAAAAVTKAKIEASQRLPAGIMNPYGGTTAPSGWLLCDGSQVNRITYSDLFAAIGTAYGEGDGSTTFHLPDLRGRFIRGYDNGAGNDPDAGSRSASNTGGNTGDNIGSLQANANKSHNHTGATGSEGAHTHFLVNGNTGFGSTPNNSNFIQNQWIDASSQAYSIRASSSPPNAALTGDARYTNFGLGTTHTHSISSDGASDSRPNNVTANYIIKT